MVKTLLFAFAGLVSAQIPKFEVVSVKPCRPETTSARRGNSANSAATFRIECQTVEHMIQVAYDFLATGTPRFRAAEIPIEGAPAWIRTEKFTIEAKPETPQKRGVMQGPMMQKVLEDRFGLKLRRETRDVPVYVMTAARGGAKLQAAKPGSCGQWEWGEMLKPPANGTEVIPCGMIGRRIDGGVARVELLGATMTNIAEGLSIMVGRDVIDQTGISGKFDIRVEVPAEELSADGKTDSNSRLDEQALAFAAAHRLGLKLESAKGPGIVFVIEHVERPAEN